MLKVKEIITAIENGEVNSGQSGSWYAFNEHVGIKVMEERFDSKKQLLASYEYDDTIKEAEAAIETKKRFRWAPECYGVKVFKIGGEWKMGIVLQNLGDTTLADKFDEDSYACDKVLNNLEKRLNKLKIFCEDLHWRNIIFFKNRYWLIDFGNVSVD